MSKFRKKNLSNRHKMISRHTKRIWRLMVELMPNPDKWVQSLKALVEPHAKTIDIMKEGGVKRGELTLFSAHTSESRIGTQTAEFPVRNRLPHPTIERIDLK